MASVCLSCLTVYTSTEYLSLVLTVSEDRFNSCIHTGFFKNPICLQSKKSNKCLNSFGCIAFIVFSDWSYYIYSGLSVFLAQVTLYHLLKLFQSDTSAILGKKTVVSEFYDEMVRKDSMLKVLFLNNKIDNRCLFFF